MAVLTVNNLSKSFLDVSIFRDVSFEVQKNEHIGLIGVNGSGKTTLFKTLTGDYRPDDGGFSLSSGAVVGYMEQHVCRDLERRAFDEVMTVFKPLTDMEDELDKINDTLLKSPPESELHGLILRQTELNDAFVTQGGLTCRGRARSALLGLGFSESQLESPVGVLSGGEKAKLQLAKMLLSGADLLLLDEPTNHLDIGAVEWLEGFLSDFKGSYIVISHDRYFLDKVTEKTFEMINGRLDIYKGNYSVYLSLRAERRLSMQRAYDSAQKEISRLEGIIEQQRRWNQERNYVTIAHKQKSIDRIEAALEKPDEEPDSIHFEFKASRRSGNDVLKAEEVSLSFDGRSLFKNVEMEIKYGEKVFLIGPNGCGKTSFLKLLLGQYRPDSGLLKLGAGLDVGYYEQSQSSLNDDKSVIDEIWDLHPRLNMTQVRNALAVFLFRGDDVFKPVGALSGGERAKLLLLKLMMSKTNFLLLDEPTNHLDIGSCEALENALSGYDGTILAVSHDRYLINKIADKIYCLSPDGVRLYEGNYDFYLSEREKEEAQKSAALANSESVAQPSANDYRLKKERGAQLRRARAALLKCEREIEENDTQLAALHAKLEEPETASNYESAMEITEQIAVLQSRCEELLSQWTELSAQVEDSQRMA